jgi:hypothetical protein
MHSELLARALIGISPETTAEEFRIRAGIKSKPIAENVLDFLSNNGIGTSSGTKILFSNADKLKIAILAVKVGCDIEQISKILTWKDFEDLTSKILRLSGYKTATHVTFCTKRQIERTKILLIKRNNISSAVPIILTLHSTKVRFINRTPIVPITEFISFLDGIEDNLSQAYVLYR